MKRLLGLLLLLTAPAHADTLTFQDGHLYRDGTDLGYLSWVDEPAVLAPRDDELFILHGDACVLLLDVLGPPASDLDGSGLVDDRDLNLVLSGNIPYDLAELLSMFGRRLDLEPDMPLVLDGYYRDADWYPVPFCEPVGAEFVNDRLLVTLSNSDVVDVDVETGDVVYVGGQTQPIPEPDSRTLMIAAVLLLMVPVLVSISRRRRR